MHSFLEKVYFGQQLAISAIVGHQSQLCFFCFEAGEKGKKFVLKVWSAAAAQYVEQDLNKSEIQDQNSHNIKGHTGGFQLLDLIIPELKSHVIPYKFKCSHWWKIHL